MKHQPLLIQVARRYAPQIGGVETHVQQLNEELIKQGYKIIVLTTQDDPSLALEETINGVEIKRMPGSDTHKLKVWQWVSQQKKLFEMAEIVQVHDVAWWLVPVYFDIKSKFFITFHGWEGFYPVRWQAKLQRWIASHLSRGSVHIGAWIQEFYWDKPDLVLYGGVVAEPKSVIKKSELKNVVFIGRLSHENDVEKYIEVIKDLKLQITWVGDGPLKAHCEEVGTVTGFLPDPREKIKNADLVFASSYLSMLQAQALGKIVVSAYSNTLKRRYLETYPGAEWLILGDNHQTIVAQIKDIWENADERTAQQTQAADWANTMTWQKVAAKYQTLWQQKLR